MTPLAEELSQFLLDEARAILGDIGKIGLEVPKSMFELLEHPMIKKTSDRVARRLLARYSVFPRSIG